MANSSFIGKAKNTIIKDIIKDPLMVAAIDSPDIKSPEKLIGTHIFNYNQNPLTIDKNITFLTVQVHIEKERRWQDAKVYVYPVIDIFVISHITHMQVDNIPKVVENRNDYIARLLDEKFNGYEGLGITTLVLTSNIEGSLQADYVYRRLTFKGSDINDAVCED